MRIALLVAGGLLAASPALAFDNGNVEQPSRITTQSGQTTAGPIATSPYSGGSAEVVYGGPPVVVDVPVAAGPGVIVGPAPAGVVVVPVR
ncbi:hypothetical protein Q8W71_20445 [Methylobacterium sp. NEAU 140]|uniref:hypothetical protein n=1 Tax=Methylobacterium sp. NEAU 140 TaxID=3064945 RepID=UPI0027338889|nr:hypothetical protein [Methylobacterium sp. NEAU 140]MDP4025001.1 hypothetical protein [Methylobacterium sp. NEAU 140]